MSSLARVAVTACLLLSCAAGAQAQDARAALGRRIDSLKIEFDRQLAEQRQLDSMRAGRARAIATDTMTAGPFIVIDTVPAEVAQVAAAIAERWREYEPMVGAAAARIAGSIVTWRLPAAYVAPRGTTVHQFAPFMHGDRFEHAADFVIRSALAEVLPGDVRAWLHGAGLQLRGGMDWAYRDLATSNSVAAQQCFDDAIAACISALGLADAGRSWEAWYTPEQLRHDVRRRGLGPGRAAACIDARDDTACLEVVRAYGGPYPPLTGAVRGTLLAHALELGGAGSFARLLEDAASVGERLERAAGQPLPQIVSSWRARVQEGRPDMHAGVATAGAWTLAWLALLALLAMRSTRWRLG
jgi:hypothetical protein